MNACFHILSIPYSLNILSFNAIYALSGSMNEPRIHKELQKAPTGDSHSGGYEELYLLGYNAV
jgi:hypothetical protein